MKQREIKFRAWDSNHNKMVYEGDNQFSESQGKILDNFEDEDLMQYIGLKDKNGVDVYEGDIIRCSAGCPHVIEFQLEYGGNTMGGMPVFYLSNMWPGYQWMGIEEIIGNIFENPDLLPKE